MSCEINTILNPLLLSEDVLRKVVDLLEDECNIGLKGSPYPDLSLKMFPTFVHATPNNDEHYEEGCFLGLDLGGTNFRVVLVDIVNDDFEMRSQMYTIPEELMHEHGEKLFDHIAQCLAEFMEEKGIKDKHLSLGFTFSFPLRQEGLNKAILTHWTKGFKCPGVEGEDVVRLLQDAIARRNDITIDVEAIVNDTTGTLMSCAFQSRDCRVGLVIGTGTNACYMENVDKISNYYPDENITVLNPHQVIVNLELGAFGDNGVLDFIRTPWDQQVDRNSKNVGKQLFEKMNSGMYLGEVARVILCDLVDKGFILSGMATDKLRRPFNFPTSYISRIETDAPGQYTEIDDILKEIDVTHATRLDCDNIKLICSRVSTRGAHLVSAAVSTILNKLKRFHTTVGVDGTVYRKHPYFRKVMHSTILKLVNPRYKFKLVLSEDGSGKGAALTAAVALKQRKLSHEMQTARI